MVTCDLFILMSDMGKQYSLLSFLSTTERKSKICPSLSLHVEESPCGFHKLKVLFLLPAMLERLRVPIHLIVCGSFLRIGFQPGFERRRLNAARGGGREEPPVCMRESDLIPRALITHRRNNRLARRCSPLVLLGYCSLYLQTAGYHV